MRLLILVFTCICLQGVAQSLPEATRTLAESSKVKDGRFAFYAVDLASGKALVSQDIDRKMSPASTQKLLTTYAALDILGPEHRFETKVGYRGSIDADGTLQGDLVIIAGGDPALDSEQFQKSYGDGTPFSNQIITALHKAGITSIHGGVYIDESIYTGIDVPDEWTWQDMGNYYGAGAHAFTFGENKFDVYFKSGSKAGALTSISRTTAELESTQPINRVEAAPINSDQAYVYSAPKSGRMTIHGRIPLNKSDFKVKAAMPDPAAEFLARLRVALAVVGITIKAPPDSKQSIGVLTDLMTMRSPRLLDITSYTNMKSNNLFAEHMLRQIGKQQKGEGSFWKGSEALEEWCQSKGISTTALRVKDGSGLSRADLVSARTMVELLQALSKESYYSEFMKALPCAGKSGSMKRIGSGTAIAGKMYAKTGYIEGVRAYAGYLEKSDGGTIAFCIMANDYDMSASQMRKEMSKLMVQLASAATPSQIKTSK